MRRVARRTTPRPSADDRRRQDQGSDYLDPRNDTEERHTLVHTIDGRASRYLAIDGLEGVARVGLAPHKQDSWKLSKDPLFTEKVRDVVGLYMNPPERALVLCVDEKTQIQALDRTQPIFPMLPTTPQRASHDYVRNGTSSLYAALDIASGKVIGSLHSRHRAQEFIAFLRKIDAQVPDDLDVHLVMDNASTHKTPSVKRWLLAHPRFVSHFTPTSSSWMNLVERWFAELTTKKLQRSTHSSVQQLNKDIRA